MTAILYKPLKTVESNPQGIGLVYPDPATTFTVNEDYDFVGPITRITDEKGAWQAGVKQTKTGDVDASWRTEIDPNTLVRFFQSVLMDVGLLGQYGQYYPTVSDKRTSSQDFVNKRDNATFNPLGKYCLGFDVDTSRRLPFQSIVPVPTSLYTARNPEWAIMGIRFSDFSDTKNLVLLADVFEQTAPTTLQPAANLIVKAALNFTDQSVGRS